MDLFCLCEAVKVAHTHICADQHLKPVFPPFVCIFHICFLYQQTMLYPLAPTTVPSFIPNWKWFPKSILISLGIPRFVPPPSHFLLFWSCSPPSCLSLSSPALKLWIGRLVASQSSQDCLRQQSVHLTLLEQKETSCW